VSTESNDRTCLCVLAYVRTLTRSSHSRTHSANVDGATALRERMAHAAPPALPYFGPWLVRDGIVCSRTSRLVTRVYNVRRTQAELQALDESAVTCQNPNYSPCDRVRRRRSRRLAM
jgi:hypothetical protein